MAGRAATKDHNEDFLGGIERLKNGEVCFWFLLFPGNFVDIQEFTVAKFGLFLFCCYHIRGIFSDGFSGTGYVWTSILDHTALQDQEWRIE